MPLCLGFVFWLFLALRIRRVLSEQFCEWLPAHAGSGQGAAVVAAANDKA